jgi:hypothetical protein
LDQLRGTLLSVRRASYAWQSRLLASRAASHPRASSGVPGGVRTGIGMAAAASEWRSSWRALLRSRVCKHSRSPAAHDVRDAWLARRESTFGAWLGVGCRLRRDDRE